MTPPSYFATQHDDDFNRGYKATWDAFTSLYTQGWILAMVERTLPNGEPSLNAIKDLYNKLLGGVFRPNPIALKGYVEGWGTQQQVLFKQTDPEDFANLLATTSISSFPFPSTYIKPSTSTPHLVGSINDNLTVHWMKYLSTLATQKFNAHRGSSPRSDVDFVLPDPTIFHSPASTVDKFVHYFWVCLLEEQVRAGFSVKALGREIANREMTSSAMPFAYSDKPLMKLCGKSYRRAWCEAFTVRANELGITLTDLGRRVARVLQKTEKELYFLDTHLFPSAEFAAGFNTEFRKDLDKRQTRSRNTLERVANNVEGIASTDIDMRDFFGV
jgi:hypothetical protein